MQGARLASPAHPRAVGRLGHLLRERPEASEEAKVDVHGQPTLPTMKEVLADRLDSLERPAVDEGGSRLETTLRRIDPEAMACEPTSLQTRRPMEGMPLRHRRGDVPRWPRATAVSQPPPESDGHGDRE